MNRRAEYYGRIAERDLRPLWEVLDELVPDAPRPAARPALWRYAEIRPAILESGDLISATEAVRRVLVLENPGLAGTSRITGALYAGLQLILPGEVAPAHRHTQSALRFIVEGTGAYTAVDGVRATMAPGDFIVTPSWTWHDHGNDGHEPVVWLDGLDIPMVALHDAQFAERHEQTTQALAEQAAARFSHPYGPSRAALAQRLADGACDPAHGVRARYLDPATGGWALPTLGAFLELFPAGFRGLPARATDGAVYCCVEGQGTARVGDELFELGPRDIFVAPSWQPRTFSATTEMVLFGYSDRPVQEALGLLREETVGEPRR